MVEFGKRNSKGVSKMMGLFRRPAPAINISATNEDGLEKALANLKVAKVHYKEAEEIIETFVRDFREKTRCNEQ
jgi:hypothetical protein